MKEFMVKLGNEKTKLLDTQDSLVKELSALEFACDSIRMVSNKKHYIQGQLHLIKQQIELFDKLISDFALLRVQELGV